ncbi:efflux RND transporter periplasmic adaptor subunit [Confluentibacter lentus]|uniref:efflux RND transporter periplasmic adaptor subunit n=1 Tax=Confluentibacter lentus TaxID=1699412 RepID=UPI000C292DCB|nr:efflux RND transporter periplasmic adaptor subunit [Confluentibacter lentus]
MNRIVAILGMFVLLLSGCQSDKKNHKETPKLQVSKPIIKDTIISKVYVCQIKSCQHIELRALERGYLQNIFVDEGQKVSKGQSMFKIMPNVYEADLQKVKSEAVVARIEYENTKMLQDENVVSKNELALSKAKLDKANAEVTLAQTHLNFTNINAPFAGVMDHLHVRVGSLLDEGELLTTLSDNSKMWVYFNMPEVEYLDYMTDTNRQSLKQVQLEMANGKLFSEPGLIEIIEGEFNNETGNIAFRAVFPNPNAILRHGETGNIVMRLPYKNALIIPQKATFEILDKKYVFVVNKDHKLEQREITVAQELPHLYIVKSGLKESDDILLEGLRRVQKGDKVEVNFIQPKNVLASLELESE